MEREDDGARRDTEDRRARLYARGLAVGLTAMSVVVAGCSSGNDAAPRGSPVPGTSAFVDDHTVSPLHVGQYIGRLKKVGGNCHGRAGTSSLGGWDVGIRIDKNCRVFVSSHRERRTRRPSAERRNVRAGYTSLTPTVLGGCYSARSMWL